VIAQEIRKMREKLQAELPLGANPTETAIVHLSTWAGVFLPEIAAQLAELNDTLKTGAVSVALCASNDSIPVVVRER
jgi:hypothetical protein